MVLNDVCEFIIDCPHTTAVDEGEGYPLIRTPNIGKGKLLLNGVHRVSEKVYLQRNARGTPRDGDLIFAREAPAGNVAVIRKGEKVCLGQRTVLLRPNTQKVHPVYLAYYLLSPEQQHKLVGSANGSTVAHVNLPTIRNLRIDIPDLHTQTQIANILAAYDDLTDSNLKKISVLEQIAENLYKEWFVRFRFPGHEHIEFINGIPKGWRVAKLRDVATEVGKSIKKENLEGYDYYLPIDCLPNKSMHLNIADNISNAESSLHSFKKGDILFGAMRPYFHKVLRAPVDGVTRKTCFVINAKQKDYAEWLYLLLYQKSTVDFATTVSVGSTMPYVRWQDFSRMNIVLPDEKTATEFSKRVVDVLNRINLFYFENDTLIKQRDLLLPRLMSGKLEV